MNASKFIRLNKKVFLVLREYMKVIMDFRTLTSEISCRFVWVWLLFVFVFLMSESKIISLLFSRVTLSTTIFINSVIFIKNSQIIVSPLKKSFFRESYSKEKITLLTKGSFFSAMFNICSFGYSVFKSYI